MSDRECTCGCCEGTTAETPVGVSNPPGLPAVSYRVGSHASFKRSLLARLSSADYPELVPRRQLPDGSWAYGLGTRRDDDWTIGLCDAFATMCDVLTFYQERIANEAFLRTAVERRSVLELSGLVGYQLAPGVAASTNLAFTLDEPAVPNVPGPPPLPVTVPIGTRVQSVPGPDELAQTYETTEVIVARTRWNELEVQQSVRELPYLDQTVAWISGTATGLSQGDVVAIIGADRSDSTSSDLWDARVLASVEEDLERNLTRVEWEEPLNHFAPRNDPPEDGARVFVLRQRTALFGANAIDPNLINFSQHTAPQRDALVSGYPLSPLAWEHYDVEVVDMKIDLESVYPEVVADSWLVLTGGTGGGLHDGGSAIYKVTGTQQRSRAAFGLSGKVTRLTLDTDFSLDLFSLDTAAVYARSEELEFGNRPLLYPLYGDQISLGSVETDLATGQRLAIKGRRARIVAPAEPDDVTFIDDPSRVSFPGESFIVLERPVKVSSGSTVPVEPEELDEGSSLSGTLNWVVLDRDGSVITIEADVGVMTLAPSLEADDTVEEVAVIDDVADAIVHGIDRTTVRLEASLASVYDRATVRTNANVAVATHGEESGEIAGDGSAAAINQRFMLHQSPLTYVASSANPSGREATLTVRVNDLEWTEVSSLYAQPSTTRVYTLRQDDDGNTVVQFGDGVEGARLPTGQGNVRFAYRKGIGAVGNVREGTITSLLSRPLGVRSAANPKAATGGEDPESRDDGRRNAPTTVLTLDRAVSALDYEDFSRAFAGIAKAVAAWIPAGAKRGMYITVAGSDGAAIPGGSETYDALLQSLRAYGDELLPLKLMSYVPASFVLGAKVMVDERYEPRRVLDSVESAVLSDFSFAARDFGMPVTIDEVMASIHSVDGVKAVDVDLLHDSEATPGTDPEPRIFPSPGSFLLDGSFEGASLLVIDPASLSIEEML